MASDPKVPSLKLNNGKEMPLLGLGTFFGLPQSEFSEEQAVHAVETAIDCGYRHIDTAWMYRTEKVIGTAVRNKIQQNVITRKDIFITSKLSYYHHSLNAVRRLVIESIENLGLGYIDLYLIHSPFAVDTSKLSDVNAPLPDEPPLDQTNDHVAVWKILEQCVQDGLIKSIGVSNFNARQLQNILDNCTIKPVINQCEIHLYLQSDELVEYCASRDVQMTAFTPLGQPLSRTVREDWKSPLTEETVVDIGKKYNKTPAQIALKYQIQRNIAVIPKSLSDQEIQENIQLFDFELNADDMKKLHSVNKNLRALPFLKFKEHKDYPFHDAF